MIIFLIIRLYSYFEIARKACLPIMALLMLSSLNLLGGPKRGPLHIWLTFRLCLVDRIHVRMKQRNFIPMFGWVTQVRNSHSQEMLIPPKYQNLIPFSKAYNSFLFPFVGSKFSILPFIIALTLAHLSMAMEARQVLPSQVNSIMSMSLDCSSQRKMTNRNYYINTIHPQNLSQ